ncbi:MAG TPA: sugar phosphate nucleotidyltransferase, partial [Thermodesulfovibrionales bacterium]|nr:sugar phosphate nucleotidyltransferase [Thermodesulfovibrionales bacterium]
MTELVNVFILAAGRGERLRPITFHIPKPLLPIVGKPVIESVLEKVILLPVKRIGINLHYKADAMRDWIARLPSREKIDIFLEEAILGTGGALRNARDFLSEGVFLVHNSDILSDIDAGALIDFHRASGNIATLAVHDFPKLNTVGIDSRGLFTGVGNSSVTALKVEKRLAFAGIAVYDPVFLRFIPNGICSVVDAWTAAANSGQRVGTFDVSGSYWTDIGTPSAYAAAVVRKLRAEGESVYIHPSVCGCSYVEMDGYVVMEEGSYLQKGASIRNCILLPGSWVKEKDFLGNCIAGPDFVLPVAEGEMLGSSTDEQLFLIGTGGSDREYYRRRWDGGSSVVVRYGRGDMDFPRHLAYTKFFVKVGVPVP